MTALLFDVFGTVVDWRGSIAAEGASWRESIDWTLFADRWRAGYVPSMDKIREGQIPWTNLDQLHRALLEELIREFRISGISEEERRCGVSRGFWHVRAMSRRLGAF